jgi:CRISPR-associated protein Cas1
MLYVILVVVLKHFVGRKMTVQKTYYIRSHGVFFRRENTLYYISGGKKTSIPIEIVRAIVVYGNLTLKGGVISLLAERGIPIQFHTENGYYISTLQNVNKNMNGLVLREQVRYALDHEKRLDLAKKFAIGAITNLEKNLQRKALKSNFKNYLTRIETCKTTEEIMGVEGNCRAIYYQNMDTVLPEGFKIERRIYHPPGNRMNALISFGNHLLYSTIMTELYYTQLHPAISYLHEPFRQRYSLALDISEVFKPIIADRVIFKLVNRKELQVDDFQQPLGNFYLKSFARDLVIKRFEEKLGSTVYHKKLRRKVSYRELIRIEAYKIQKHILNDQPYEPYIVSR